MKKFLTLALCLAATGSICAQKQVVDQASKLSGKNDKIGEARSLIQQATENEETKSDARTYYVGGKIEFDAFDNTYKKQMINPNDPSINPLEMGEQLINGYNLFMKALPLDSVPNAKGEVKPKFSKDIASKIMGHYPDYFTAGGNFYNDKKYAEAYEAFMIHGLIPSLPFATKEIKATPDSIVNMSFFNAGISAWAGDDLEKSAFAFKCARLNNSDNPQHYIQELACWQYLANRDSTKVEPAKYAILEIAQAGFDKFGMTQPIFAINLVNSLVLENKTNEALSSVSDMIEKNPDNASLYSLRGYVYDYIGSDDESVNDYRKAAEMPDADFSVLKEASKKIFKVGTQKWNNIEGASPAERQNVKENYFLYAKELTNRAKALNDSDSELKYVIENIDYALETYFNN